MNETQTIRLAYCLLITISFLIAGIGRCFHERKKHHLIYIVIIGIALLIGSRPVIASSDLASYEVLFNRICRNGWSYIYTKFNEYGQDPFFSILMFITAPFRSFKFTITIISLISLLFTYQACKIYTRGEHKGSSLLLFFCTIINFTFLNQQDNVMRIGVAFPLLLIYIYYYFRKEYKKAIIFGILAVGIHFSMAAAIIVSIVAKYTKCSLRWYYLLFFLVMVASAAGASLQHIAGMFGFGKAEFYSKLTESGGYRTGFRVDFALFNTAFLLFFAWLNKNRLSEFMLYYIRMFVLFSCWFFLWFKVPYNDRVGAFSWNLIPIISYFGCIEKFPRNKNIWGVSLFIVLLLMNLVIHFF